MRIYIILFLCFLVASCQKSDQEKAEILIRDTIGRIDKDDIKNEYIAFEFGQLTKAKIDYELTYPAFRLQKEMEQSIKAMREKSDFINKWKNINPSGLKDDIRELNEYAEHVELLGDSIKKEKECFCPDTTRLMLNVRFQILNKATKQKTEENSTFYFDKNVTRIVGILGSQDNTHLYIEYEGVPSHNHQR